MKYWIHAAKQLINTWRSNIGIFVELILVLGVAWYMVDYFFVQLYNRHLPAGRSIEDTYVLRVATLPESDPAYQAAEADSAAVEANVRRVVERVKAYPGVQAVGISYGCGSQPYSSCYSGNQFVNMQDTSRRANFMAYKIDPREDFLGVFRHVSAVDGHAVRMDEFDWTDPHAIVITRRVEQQLMGDDVQAGASVGLKVCVTWGDPDIYYIVKGVLQDVKRFDDRLPGGDVFQPSNGAGQELADRYISFRIDPAVAGAGFAERFELEMGRQLRIGNCYLYDVRSYEQIRRGTELQFGTTYNWNIRISLLIFLGLNILLCVMGSFWYRVRQRRGEIGLRMAMGSSRRGVWSQLLREGVCILALATPVALFIEMHLAMIGLVDLPYGETPVGYLPAIGPLRFLLTNVVAWLLVAGVICLAVWLPASRAAKEDPAV
ncbi:MAG: ABC transporter permease, partial [Parabacteroides sp.]